MSKLEQVEAQVKQLSVVEQRALHDWLENLLEDRLELKDEFKAEIETGIQDVAEGRYRTRQPWILPGARRHRFTRLSLTADFSACPVASSNSSNARLTSSARTCGISHTIGCKAWRRFGCGWATTGSFTSLVSKGTNWFRSLLETDVTSTNHLELTLPRNWGSATWWTNTSQPSRSSSS